jgi:eukaryotic-like serine/threonine-protein kinase
MVDDPDDAADTLRGGPDVTPAPADPDDPDALGTAATGIVHTPLPRRAAVAPTVAAGAIDRTTSRGGPHARRRGDSQLGVVTDRGRYRFGEVLGEGGMGEVLLAHDEHIGRDVAVKRIRAAEPSAEELTRFVREARVQGRLEHPAVVPVHDLAVDGDGRPFFVMKRLTGTTMLELLARLRDGREPDPAAVRRRLLRAFADVCLAIEFAHSCGVIHRDLKPANIMLGDFGEVYVLDWGVARAAGDLADLGGQPSGVTGPASGRLTSGLGLDTGDTQVGTVLGTPAYMAPEQLAGERAGPAADVYALGCILFEITTGGALHGPGRSVGEALTQPAARASARRPDVPPELDAICEKATRTDAAARFASARAVGDAVQAFLDGDRDLAARAALAAEQVAKAKAALAQGEDEASRRVAIQAAGRALALDPTASEAAELVSHLMLRPPREVPAEVEREVDRIDTETARHQARLGAVSLLGYLGFVPVLIWTGVRDPVFVVAFAGLAAASALHVFLLSRRTDIRRGGIYANACLNAVLIALISRMVGPFIIAPTLATTTLMAYAAHPKFGRIAVVAGILGAAIAVPWALELAGVLAPTYRFTAAGELVLGSSVVRFSSAPVQVAFAMLLVALLAIVGLLSRVLARRQREATRALELHAWHLRQIVPSLSR